jgi:hypothetical protein
MALRLRTAGSEISRQGIRFDLLLCSFLGQKPRRLARVGNVVSLDAKARPRAK